MTPRRVLFIAEGQLGDLLLLTPALRGMKEAFPAASVSVLILERRSNRNHVYHDRPDVIKQGDHHADTALSTNPNVDETFILDRSLITSQRGISRIRTELEIIRFLRRKKFDTVISTFPEDRFSLWSYATGAPVRIGQGDQSFSWLLTHKLDITKGDRGVLEYYCELARATGAVVASDRTEYIIPGISEKWADSFLQQHQLHNANQLVAVHPGATGEYKIWPPDRYAALIDFLQSELGVSVVLCHSSRDHAVIEKIRMRLLSKVVEAATENGVGHLAALVKRCALCISNDSGPRHLAMAVGTPTLALFRRFHEKEWGIYGKRNDCTVLQGDRPCQACPPGVCRDKIPDNEQFGSFCLRMVEVDFAISHAKAMLAFLKNK